MNARRRFASDSKQCFLAAATLTVTFRPEARLFLGCHRLALWRLTLLATRTLPLLRKVSGQSRRLGPPRSSGDGWVLCGRFSEKPNDLQGQAWRIFDAPILQGSSRGSKPPDALRSRSPVKALPTGCGLRPPRGCPERDPGTAASAIPRVPVDSIHPGSWPGGSGHRDSRRGSGTPPRTRIRPVRVAPVSARTQPRLARAST